MIASVVGMYNSAAAQDNQPFCELSNPAFVASDSNATFSIDMTCDGAVAGDAADSLQRDVLLGLTLYALDERRPDSPDTTVDQLLAKAPQGKSDFSVDETHYSVDQKPFQPSKPPRRIISDEPFREDAQVKSPFDVPAQAISIETEMSTHRYSFEVSSGAIRDYNYFLFALWRASSKTPCDKSESYARSGCKLYGYVIGDLADVEPLDYYPGMASFDSAQVDKAERWIVEKFR
ncbi:hypothetical protein J2045_001956 [Peteryoungia aggregata LMG 23059]|uniref:Uncharacterized protein n=1 Tax=Peteryoungia aggregata LMG 23059 TaxID=1368425 RepID=A0ABU0G6F8_9HYPH|nr:hypothetical protein [Peteryoungia aggregata]MDQ0420929.1 hypothetical protein [Peteryoungia aggregata LMG 23059]